MNALDLNPWGFTAIAAAVVSLSFAYFLWKTAAPTPITRRFIFLLLVEIVTALTSSAGIPLLFNYTMTEEHSSVLDIIHHIGDFLMLFGYPVFVAYALPLKALKPLTTKRVRYPFYVVGLLMAAVFNLAHFDVIKTDIEVDMWLYLALVIMFVVVFVFSLFAVSAAKTKLAREKSLAFVCAFGFRDLAWATVYLSAVTGWVEQIPILISQLYMGPTLIYIPIMVYGILKLQMLDIEIRLKTTIRNSVLAGIFGVMFYLITEGANTLISDQFGGMIGFGISALLTLFLTPFHKWADRVSSRLVSADIEKPDYEASRSLQIYSGAVEETLAFPDITKGHVALLDRLAASLNLSMEDAMRLERDLAFDRTAVHA